MKNLKKKIYICVGLLALGLGIIGVFLPVMPTVPFLLVALFSFERSSKKYHDMILNNKYFGKVLKDYYEGKGLTISVKIKAILFLSCGIGFSFYKVQHLHLRIMLVVIWLGVTIHIILLKTKPKEK
ncbi:Inner membrane protein YbaN [Fusobacterium nucleatum]|uniref:YbaN family protein n=1 Tax=Fusobacterium nucleatum TaxID=851 RepID=UPI0019596430|nr:YbaN family protein [Fusobacterium nucleatum]VTX76381.1 Inner membrane protein YbaN [Fusobacterium nucleatum]